MDIKKTNDPALKSWVEVSHDSDFPIQNLPFGIARSEKHTPRAISRLGDHAIDLSALADWGYLDDVGIKDFSIFRKDSLNDFIALGRPVWRALRERLSDLFNAEHAELRDNSKARARMLYPVTDIISMMPVTVGDYTDFYASLEHATNVGTMFRGPDNALFPNWKHLPVGYHGRSSSIVISGTDIHRPKGQVKPDSDDKPSYGPTRLMDFELEMAFITGKANALGESVNIKDAEEHIFGLVLFNDLSARDIQKWEYVPLGPFLGKNFGSVVSPWIVTLDALEPFRTNGPEQHPEVLPYLKTEPNKNYDINLEVYIQPETSHPSLVCRSNCKYLYWSMVQQLAHHTVNGCNMNIGDMCASGTISGPNPGAYGSMLELSWKGTKTVMLDDGSERKFINDNDTIIMKGYGIKNGVRIGFGETKTKILPATP